MNLRWVRVAAAAVSLALASWTMPGVRTSGAEPPAAPATKPAPEVPRFVFDDFVDDKAVTQFVEAQGRKLLKSGRLSGKLAVPTGKAHCDLKLPVPDAGKELSTSEVVRRCGSAVTVVGVFYTCKKCSDIHLSQAGGFFLNSDGAMATCLHVVAPDKSMKSVEGAVVLTRDGRLCPVTAVLAADPLNDLVVLQVEGGGFGPVLLSDDAPPGSPVTVVSHPDGRFFTVSAGIVARRHLDPERGGTRKLSITADFAGGSSGSPVFNAAGAAVGVVNNTESLHASQDSRGRGKDLQMVVKNCTPAQALRELCRPAAVPRTTDASAPPAKAADTTGAKRP